MVSPLVLWIRSVWLPFEIQNISGMGFAHGLLNTDNMSLLGLTLDYGPFGFVDSYDGGFVPNCCDGEGRYALAKQPDVINQYFGLTVGRCWFLSYLFPATELI